MATPHTRQKSLNNLKCTSTWIASKYVDIILSNLEISVVVLQVNVLIKYKRIKDYAQIIFDKMPQATTLVKVNKVQVSNITTIFDRFVVAFHAIRDGFNNMCRPFIKSDGCHLNGLQNDVLLSAVALDENTTIYPLALCICDFKNINT